MTRLALMTSLGGCLKSVKKVAISVDTTMHIGTACCALSVFGRCTKQRSAQICIVSRDLLLL